MLDPAQLMRDAGMAPDTWQENVLRSESKRMLLLCSRQSGKSTTSAALAVSQALYDPGLVLIIAPAQRQSSELFRKVTDLYRALPDVPRIVQESALRMELDNGSRIVALPGTEATIRGYSGAKTVIIDEASRVDDALFAAVRPMLATTQGRFVALTTPWGKRGWFYEAWAHGEGWEKTRVTAHQCPRIDPDWLADERRLIGDFQFSQEYACEFVDIETQLFSSDMIDAALTDEVAPLWN
ncbi:MAG: phage terminase large subunit [Luteimonas sp.]